MSLRDDRVHPLLQRASSLFLLNLLWVLASLPLVTLAPATAAMFGVVRQWLRGQEPELFTAFFSLFRENFWQSLLLGLLWLAVAALIAVNVLLAGQAAPPLSTVVLVLSSVVGLFFLLTSPYLFASIVHFKAGWIVVVRNAVLLAVSAPHLSLLGLGVLVLMGFIVYSLPVTILLGAGAFAAYLLYWLFHQSTLRLEP